MDVYLKPLVEELEELWSGIQVHDMSRKFGERHTTIRGILMWTMHDWPEAMGRHPIQNNIFGRIHLLWTYNNTYVFFCRLHLL